MVYFYNISDYIRDSDVVFDKLLQNYCKLDSIAVKMIKKLAVIGFVVVVLVAFVAILVYFASKGRTLPVLTSIYHKDFKNVDFPEQVFQPNKKYDKLYHENVKKGQEVIGNSKIVIAGLARNVSWAVDRTMQKLLEIGGMFKEFKIVVYENDSKDKTRALLAGYEQVEFVPCSKDDNCILNEELPSNYGLISKKRMQEMAKMRNKVLKHIKKNYSDYDYMMVVDFDLDGPISPEGMATCFAFQDWNAMAANGIMLNRKSIYDTIEYVPVDKKAKPLGKDSFTFQRPQFFRGQPPQHVKSAFGGCVIYRLKPLIDEDIEYHVPDDFVVSEHVAFHLEMIQNGLNQIFVNPSFIVLHLTR